MGRGAPLRLDLPWPPTANLIWRTAVIRGVARQYLTREGQRFRFSVQRVVGPVQPILGPVSIRIIAFAPDRRRRDLDNLLKATLDALTHAGVWRDDSQLVRIDIARGEPAIHRDGLLRVEISREELFA